MEKENKNIICDVCQYAWKSRVEKPKHCPRCGKWLEAWKVKPKGE
jgi:hypothetical protein